MTGTADPPSGDLTLRPADVADAEAISGIVNEVFLAEIGEPWTTPEEVRDGLTRPARDQDLLDAVVVDDQAIPVAYLEFHVTTDPLEVAVFPFVLPRLWGRGINAWLLRVGEERARARVAQLPAGSEAMVLAAGFRHNEPARRLFEQLGYRYERTFRLMRIELASGIETPVPPAGIQIRTVDPDRDLPAVHGVLFGAFADHWGGAFDGFDEWRHRSVDGEGASFDPRLWFVAVDEGEVVGAACCIERSPRAADTAVIETLGVMRDRRHRGIARALLLTAFEEFARRGIARAELSVDADNTTGATRLYERVGMRVAYMWDFWRKDVTASA